MIPILPQGFSHPMSIGEGTFGSVYRVRQHYLDRWVAFKIIIEKRKIRRSEFLKEAKVQAKIKADCVPQIFDAFEWKQSVCIVMQWVKGISLLKVLERECSLKERITIAAGLIDALAQLHSLGFAHRDIKPANILIEPNNGIYLVDFGFTKDITDAFGSSMSTANGTPAYMAPEIWQKGGNIDLMRADVYATGMVLREIFDNTEMISFTKCLVERNPDIRPESGKTVRNLWLQSKWSAYPLVEWKPIVERNYKNELSDKLFQASRQLIDVKRFNEAYELMLESLEENPDNNDTIELMSRFASLARRKPINNIIYGIGIIFLGIATVVSYFAGIHSGKNHIIKDNIDGQIRVLLKYDELNDIPTVLPLKTKQDKSGYCNGYLIIDRSDSSLVWNIYIDSILYTDSINTLQKQINLSYGMHTVLLKDLMGNILYRESVNLLPFQTKRIKLLPVQKD